MTRKLLWFTLRPGKKTFITKNVILFLMLEYIMSPLSAIKTEVTLLL